MTPDLSQWRSTPDYAYIDNLVPPDVAWEWLRRNEDYQRDYVAIETKPPPSDAAAASLRKAWGLQFFRPAVPDGSSNDHLLVA